MILDLHRQGLSVSVIARRIGLDRKTVRRYLARGLEPPVYGLRQPRTTQLQRFERYLRERVTAFPQLTGRRLHRELRELGYTGGYTILTDFLREIRPSQPVGFEVRFETPPGRQAAPSRDGRAGPGRPPRPPNACPSADVDRSASPPTTHPTFLPGQTPV